MRDNVEIVEKIRLICREKGSSLTKLEESLSWSNGYIGKWVKAKKRIPIERLMMVAKQLDVPLYEITGKTDEKIPPLLPVDLGDGETKITPAPISEDGLSEYDTRLLAWFHSLPAEKRRAILEIADGPKE